MTALPVATSFEDALLRVSRRAAGISLGEVVVFLAIVQEGSFTAAARRLHLSQPGVSGRVSRLEHTLGFRLLDRSRRQVCLTPDGYRFVHAAQAMVRTVDEVMNPQVAG
jgi:DNA-binding transcriptional LysR family regulator